MTFRDVTAFTVLTAALFTGFCAGWITVWRWLVP